MEASCRVEGNDVISWLTNNHLLQYSKEVEHSMDQAMKRNDWYDKKHKSINIEKGSLVPRYDN